MRVLILGGDGFCGWPTSLHLSARGHEVAIVDNGSRRRIDEELGAGSLTPIADLEARLSAWTEVSGRTIAAHTLTVGQDFEALLGLLKSFRPDAIAHFAEQRAAPYSMKSARHKRYTVGNNVSATHDVLAAIVDSGLDVHLAHLGTMGVYGYGSAGVAIPEGYLTVQVETAEGWSPCEILYPAAPGSIYHLTKTQDALAFQFYAKNDGLRITDQATQPEPLARDRRNRGDSRVASSAKPALERALCCHRHTRFRVVDCKHRPESVGVHAPVVKTRDELSVSVPVAVNCSVCPTLIVGFTGVTAIELEGTD